MYSASRSCYDRSPNSCLDAKRSKIKELLTYIEERLAELEEEKEELKEFQDKDKERRCLEYALYSRELTEVGQQLEEVRQISLSAICRASLDANLTFILTVDRGESQR